MTAECDFVEEREPQIRLSKDHLQHMRMAVLSAEGGEPYGGSPKEVRRLVDLGFLRSIIEKVDLGPYGEDAVITHHLTPAGRDWMIETGRIQPDWKPDRQSGALRLLWEKRPKAKPHRHAPARARATSVRRGEKVSGGCTVYRFDRAAAPRTSPHVTHGSAGGASVVKFANFRKAL